MSSNNLLENEITKKTIRFLIIHINKEDLALYDLQELICCRTPSKQSASQPNEYTYIYI